MAIFVIVYFPSDPSRDREGAGLDSCLRESIDPNRSLTGQVYPQFPILSVDGIRFLDLTSLGVRKRTGKDVRNIFALSAPKRFLTPFLTRGHSSGVAVVIAPLRVAANRSLVSRDAQRSSVAERGTENERKSPCGSPFRSFNA
jgi:hypothetical protein